MKSLSKYGSIVCIDSNHPEYINILNSEVVNDLTRSAYYILKDSISRYSPSQDIHDWFTNFSIPYRYGFEMFGIITFENTYFNYNTGKMQFLFDMPEDVVDLFTLRWL